MDNPNHPEEPKDQAELAKESEAAGRQLEHPKVHREVTDVRWGCLIALACVIPICAACVFFGIWTFFGYSERHEQSSKLSKYPLAPVPSSALPSEPRLEPLNRIAGNTAANDFDIQLAQEKQLTTFGPTTEKGFIHIPIQDAIKLVVPQLKVRKQLPEESHKDNGLRFGGGPNSGRVFEEPTP